MEKEVEIYKTIDPKELELALIALRQRYVCFRVGEPPPGYFVKNWITVAIVVLIVLVVLVVNYLWLHH